MKRWGWVVQVFWLAIGGVLTGFAVCCVFTWLHVEREFKAGQAARPVSVPADFSKPGEVTAPLLQTYCVSHDEMLCLELTPQPQQGQATTELLNGIQGTYVIRNEAGEEVRCPTTRGIVTPQFLSQTLAVACRLRSAGIKGLPPMCYP